jgi:type IV pilus biogenesis protein CpaD/CtpE
LQPWKPTLATALIALLAGCGAAKPLTLMSTPVIYHQAAIDPFAHLPETERVPEVSVFYATNRAPRQRWLR